MNQCIDTRINLQGSYNKSISFRQCFGDQIADLFNTVFKDQYFSVSSKIQRQMIEFAEQDFSDNVVNKTRVRDWLNGIQYAQKANKTMKFHHSKCFHLAGKREC